MTPLDKARDEAHLKWASEFSVAYGINNELIPSLGIVAWSAAWDACLAHITASEEMKSVRAHLSEVAHTDENGVHKGSPQIECEALASYAKFREGK